MDTVKYADISELQTNRDLRRIRTSEIETVPNFRNRDASELQKSRRIRTSEIEMHPNFRNQDASELQKSRRIRTSEIETHPNFRNRDASELQKSNFSLFFQGLLLFSYHFLLTKQQKDLEYIIVL